jgi:hypothetical protein
MKINLHKKKKRDSDWDNDCQPTRAASIVALLWRHWKRTEVIKSSWSAAWFQCLRQFLWIHWKRIDVIKSSWSATRFQLLHQFLWVHWKRNAVPKSSWSARWFTIWASTHDLSCSSQLFIFHNLFSIKEIRQPEIHNFHAKILAVRSGLLSQFLSTSFELGSHFIFRPWSSRKRWKERWSILIQGTSVA